MGNFFGLGANLPIFVALKRTPRGKSCLTKIGGAPWIPVAIIAGNQQFALWP